MNPSVLIVDDEINIRMMLRTALETEGYFVEEATNGREALNSIERNAFDVVVLDLNMPVLDGIGVLDNLQKSHTSSIPRVIVLTAYGSIVMAVKATRLGALDFLEKPASPQELRDAVAALLKEPQPAREVKSGEPLDGYEGVLNRARKALRLADYASAESMLMKAADLGHNDAAYFNLLGIIYEARHQCRLAKKFYGKSIAADKQYEPAQKNMRRIYELNTFGKSNEPATLGDELDIWFAKFPEKLGASDVLAKPVDPDDLGLRVAAVLGENKDERN